MIKVPIARPLLGEEEVAAAARVVRSGWVTQGPEVAAFEGELAASMGSKHAVAVSNCTVALELAMRCLGVGLGDDVVTVSHSFIATVNSIVNVGARPILCDIEEDTFGMSPAALERSITPKTKAVMCVHQIGIPCDLERIVAIADAHGLPVIEDAACAIGSEICWNGTWERIGRPRGKVACFSFHPRKVVTTGDGGMLTTNDEGIAARAKLLRQHAMSVPDTIRHHANQVIYESYTEPAFNYRMTDLQAAIGRPQLARLADIIAERRRLADKYKAALANSRMFRAPIERATARSNWQSYPVHLLTDRPQRDILQALLDRGIAAKPGIMNAHSEPAYADGSRWGGSSETLTVSERARRMTILIPLFHGMTDEEQAAVVGALDEIERMG